MIDVWKTEYRSIHRGVKVQHHLGSRDEDFPLFKKQSIIDAKREAEVSEGGVDL